MMENFSQWQFFCNTNGAEMMVSNEKMDIELADMGEYDGYVQEAMEIRRCTILFPFFDDSPVIWVFAIHRVMPGANAGRWRDCYMN